MKNLTTRASVAREARKRLSSRHEFYHSWADVSEELGGVNRGLLCAVANGARKPTPAVLRALGLPIFALAPAPVCPVHGVIHQGRCPRHKPTFEENCVAWDAWRAAHAEPIAAMVQWAEERTDG